MGVGDHRAEQQRQVCQGVEVEAQRRAAVGSPEEAHGAGDEADTQGQGGHQVDVAEAAGAEGQLGDRVEQDRIQQDLPSGLVLAADDRHHRHADLFVLVLHQQ